MALKTFHFTASIPAHRDYLEPLGRMIAHALEYVGVTKGEADTEAAALAAKVEQEIGAGVRGQVHHRALSLVQRDGRVGSSPRHHALDAIADGRQHRSPTA